MKFLNRLTMRLGLVLALVLGSASASAAVLYQLGFALDGSGSVSTTNYNLLKSGLSAAMDALPADGTVEITVVAYGSSANLVVTPTVLDAGSLASIKSIIETHAKAGGGTNTSGAITTLANAMVGSANYDPAIVSIMNLATDGFPNSQSNSEAAAQAAEAAGIDALSIEAIGDGVSSNTALANLALIAFPDPVTILGVNETNLPNPANGSFVVPVTDFDALSSVLEAKVVASVQPPSDVPAPGVLLLLAIGAVGLASVRRLAA